MSAFDPKRTLHQGDIMQARLVLGIVAVGAVAFTAGYVAGFRTAWPMSVQAEYVARGALATIMLPAMRRGRTDMLATYFERDLDYGLLLGGDFVESAARPLLPLMGIEDPAESEHSLSRTASYRKANPREVPFEDAKSTAVINARIERYSK